MANNYMVSNKKQIGPNYGISDVLFYTDKKWIVWQKPSSFEGFVQWNISMNAQEHLVVARWLPARLLLWRPRSIA